jgi:hypothetical protein
MKSAKTNHHGWLTVKCEPGPGVEPFRIVKKQLNRVKAVPRQEDSAHTYCKGDVQVWIAQNDGHSQIRVGRRLGCKASDVSDGQKVLNALFSSVAFTIFDCGWRVDRCVRVVRPGDVGAFCAFLHSPGRALPVIAITERRSDPVDAEELALRLLGCAHVVIIQSDATCALKANIGSDLDVDNGATRLWFSKMHWDSRCGEHPLFLADVPAADVQREILELIAQSAGLRIAARSASVDAEAKRRSTPSGDGRVVRRFRSGATSITVEGIQCQVEAEVCRHAGGTIKPFVIRDSFVESFAKHGNLSKKIVRTCARVLCVNPDANRKANAQKTRTSRCGGSADLVRDDGAKHWHAYTERGCSQARRLDYWVCTDGTVEFVGVRNHDEKPMY